MLWVFLLLAIIGLVYYFATKPHSYWPKRHVKQNKPWPFFGDNWGPVLRRHSFADMVYYWYNMVPGVRYSGAYQFAVPTLVLKDPELIKQITVKDFDHFTDHRSFVPEEHDLMGKNLFALKGKRWRDMRATLSPSFTSSKMRSMYALMSGAAEKFINYFQTEHKSQEIVEIEMKDTFTRFTCDVIATTAFGVEVDSLKNRENIFYTMGMEATNFGGIWKNLKFFGFMVFPNIYKLFKITMLGKTVNDFFINLVQETIKAREEQKIVRPDMIHLLMEARKGNTKIFEDKPDGLDTGFATVKEALESTIKTRTEITDIDIAAQALVFFFGGFDSVSALMCFTAHELAVNPEVQTKLRKEVQEVLSSNHGKVTYDALLQMKYMDMVLCETLRKWPNAVGIDRVCTKEYTIEPKLPGEKPVHLVPGDVLWLPIYGLHHDPQYFPNPEKYDPERFNDENKSEINPYVYIPFGSGPRNCIGSRFAILETKAIIFHILSTFEIVPTAKTPQPLKLSKKTFNLVAEGGFWLGMKPLKKSQ